MPVFPNPRPESKSRLILLAALTLLLALAGCGSRNVASGAAAPAGPTGPWFCEPATDGDGWDCSDNPERVANPRPSQPLARVLAARDAAEAEARAAEAASLDAAGDSLMTTAAIATSDVAATDEPSVASATAPSVKDPETPIEEPAYARLAYRPEQPVSLLELPPNFYAVQIIALSSTAELERFFNRLGVSELTAAEVEVDGELRYVLLLGIYETFAAAEAAAANPPQALMAYEPWIRRLGGLQAAMLRAERRRQ